jgi:NADPH:quinone reductase-like Zn-dependent oxidoreductase
MSMKAAIRTGVLGYSLTFSKEHSSPSKPKEKDSLLVKVHSGSINPVDYKLPRSVLGSVVGLDFCGTIAEVDLDCDGGFEVGDVVFGICKGALAEYTVAKSNEVAKAPKGWKATDCAALPTAYMSALQCLRKGKILLDNDNDNDIIIQGSSVPTEKSKSVLIIGASGGCGLAGLQLCVALSVSRIVAICSEKNRDLVRKHGATEVVDYANKSELESFFSENQGKFDCVYDAATQSGGGEDYWKKSIGLLRRDDGHNNNNNNQIVGEYTALNGSPTKWIRALVGAQKDHETIIMKESNASDLKLVAQLMDRIGAKPFTKVMTFDEEGLREAFELLKSRRTRGKIVFDVCAM